PARRDARRARPRSPARAPRAVRAAHRAAARMPRGAAVPTRAPLVLAGGDRLPASSHSSSRGHLRGEISREPALAATVSSTVAAVWPLPGRDSGRCERTGSMNGTRSVESLFGVFFVDKATLTKFSRGPHSRV